jgi:hypothetical protein
MFGAPATLAATSVLGGVGSYTEPLPVRAATATPKLTAVMRSLMGFLSWVGMG